MELGLLRPICPVSLKRDLPVRMVVWSSSPQALACTYANGSVKSWALALRQNHRNKEPPFPWRFTSTV